MNRAEFIKKKMFGKTLDVGCEAGKLHELIKSQNVYGLDLKVRNFGKNSIIGDAQSMSFKDESFDTVIAGELIEHLPNPENFLKESKRVLKKNGILIITTPNKKSWVNRILKSSFHRGHISLFDIPEIKKIVGKYFEIEEFFCLPYDSVSSWGSRFKKMFWLRKFIHHLAPQSLQEDIIILGRKKL